MNNQTSTKQLEKLTDELTVDELEIVAGGTWLTSRIHIDYHNLNNFNDKTAVRLA